LTRLTDGKLQTNRWSYDSFGRVTNKVDATNTEILRYQYDLNNRMTNRWSITKGSTTYRYDKVSNLTNVVYPGTNVVYSGTNVTYSYDARNLLLSMNDGVGVTAFTYDAVGQLSTEDGPWADDTVRITMSSRLRTAMSIDQPNASAWAESYVYDGGKRLTNLTSPAGGFAYAYDSTRLSKIKQIQLPGGAVITNAYDSVSRQTETWLRTSPKTSEQSTPE